MTLHLHRAYSAPGKRKNVDEPAHYEIEVAEVIDARWSDWFGGLDLSQGDSGSTMIRGEIADQAALFGILYRIRDLGLTLISVQRKNDRPLALCLTTAGPIQEMGTIAETGNEGR